MARKSKTRKQNKQTRPANTRHGLRPHITLKQSEKRSELQSALEIHQQGNLPEARQRYEAILLREPEHAEALHLLGVIEHQSGEHHSAVKTIERAVELKPEAVLFRKNLASACRAAGQLEKASQICEAVLSCEPEDVLQWTLLGRIHEERQLWESAVQAYQQVLARQPDPAEQLETLVHLGDCYSRLGQREESCRCFRKVLEQSPQHLIATHNLARELQYQERFAEAEQYYQQALEIDSGCASAWNNLGVIKQTQADFTQARVYLERALQFGPQLPDVYNNLANVLEAAGEGESCRDLFMKAIALRPDYAEAQHSLSQLELREQQFEAGWERYRWRLRKQDHDHRYYGHPEWRGEPLQHRSLLVYSEQGIGDLVMFASCLPQVFERVKNVTLEVDARLTTLFRRSFPEANIITRPVPEHPYKKVLTGIDYQISLADLPALFRTETEKFPRQSRLLTPAEPARQKWRERYQQLGEGLKIGISWFGGKNYELQQRRTMPLQQWQPILQTPGIQWINLQYGPAAEDRHLFHRQTGIEIHDWSGSNPLIDLDDFAAKLAELDLVISIDNSTVHFAGGVGVPTWCLLTSLPDWRWGLESQETLWYQSVRLFRQQQQLNWQPVVEQVTDQLQQLLRPGTPDRAIHRPSLPPQPMIELPPSVMHTETAAENRAQSQPVQPAELQRPRCAIISPVGPGHAAIYEQAERSIRDACLRGAGPFREIIPFRIDDHQGTVGRSRARNFAVQQAKKQGIEWVFFLDADDLLVPEAFVNVEPYLQQYDAIWGQIFSFADGTNRAERRAGQLEQTDRFEDVLNGDPYLTLQMGHFVRTDVALSHPFNEQMDVGEDFDYYLRVWEQHRCIKLDQPLFANRRGRHSSGPRSASGRDWTIVVNRLLENYRQNNASAHLTSRPVQVQSVSARVENRNEEPESATISRQMKIAIYGMMRSGTTLLCDKLTVPGQGLILLEPNIHLEGRPDHIRRQLERFGIELPAAEWQDVTTTGSFQPYFDQHILPELQKLKYWGVKMVNFSHWEQFLSLYPADHLLLCIRDIRDVVLSALDLAPHLNSTVDEQWIEKRACETAEALVAMSKRPHLLLRYEDFCTQPSMIDNLARQLGLSQAGNERIGLEAVPHRLYEEEKHGGRVSSRSVNRFSSEPAGPARQLAERVWQQCSAYCERFGYPVFSQAATPPQRMVKPVEKSVLMLNPVRKSRSTDPPLPLGKVLSSAKNPVVSACAVSPLPSSGNTAKEKTMAPPHPAEEFWKQDRLANIIPRNQQLGKFPEGWDVRPYLWELLQSDSPQRILEVGCGYGRLCQAFPAEKYLGVDVNPEAIRTAQSQHPEYTFQTVGFEADYPQADALLVYTVLLHIDDLTVGPMLQRMCAASPVILIAEILGRQRWRRSGNPPVFNRDQDDYVHLMQDLNYRLVTAVDKPYVHYSETNISFLKFVRHEESA